MSFPAVRPRARAVASALAVAALAGPLAVVTAAPAAALPAQLSLAITSSVPAGSYVAVGTHVTFTYTVTNNTGSTLSVPQNAGVELFLKNDFDAAEPVVGSCTFGPWGFGDFGSYVVDSWMLDLPSSVPPGQAGSCTVSYTAAAPDIAYGGLWTMLAYEPDTTLDSPQWDYSAALTVPAAGHADHPTVTGTPSYGSRLSVSPGLWGPWDDATFQYQWLRNGSAIAGATLATYTAAAEDVGTQLTVRMQSDTTGLVEVSPAVTITRFSDVPSGYAFDSYISWLAGKGISTGYAQPDGSWQFKPTTAVSREAMAAFLYRDIAPGGYTPPATTAFGDVPTSYPFYTNIAWLAEQGISTGYADGTFKPTAAVTREAMAAFLYRAAGSPAYTPPTTPRFTDVPPSYPFYTQVSWLADQAISTGYADGTFKPTAPVTREAMAAFLKRADPIFHPVP